MKNKENNARRLAKCEAILKHYLNTKDQNRSWDVVGRHTRNFHPAAIAALYQSLPTTSPDAFLCLCVVLRANNQQRKSAVRAVIDEATAMQPTTEGMAIILLRILKLHSEWIPGRNYDATDIGVFFDAAFSKNKAVVDADAKNVRAHLMEKNLIEAAEVYSRVTRYRISLDGLERLNLEKQIPPSNAARKSKTGSPNTRNTWTAKWVCENYNIPRATLQGWNVGRGHDKDTNELLIDEKKFEKRHKKYLAAKAKKSPMEIP